MRGVKTAKEECLTGFIASRDGTIIVLSGKGLQGMGTELEQRLALARAEVARRLSTMYKTWSVVGNAVVGPGTLAVHVEDQHKVGPTHFDIGFVLNRDRSDVPVIWDCIAGVGRTEEEVISRAVETWATCTASTVLEMLVRDGSFASHFDYENPDGCPGWHVVHGPIIAFGKGSAPTNLQAWLADTPLLPTLGPMVASAFERPILNGVKLLFGFAQEDIAEVRVNGVVHEPASRRLKLMKWPRQADAAFTRCYWLFVHNRDSDPPQITP